jgi:glutamine synthetase
MKRRLIVFVGTSDFGGEVRGNGFPLSALDKRRMRGVGRVSIKVQITCFDLIADSPCGDPFCDTYLAHKRGELAYLQDWTTPRS